MPESTGTEGQVESHPVNADTDDDNGYHQLFNEKGIPINPATTATVESQIRAKNEVLEAVGVCERRNELSNVLSRTRKQRSTLGLRESCRQEEDNDARFLHMTARFSHLWQEAWLIGLRYRLQVSIAIIALTDHADYALKAGLVDVYMPFSLIFAHEWRMLSSHGIMWVSRRACMTMTPPILAATASVLGRRCMRTLEQLVAGSSLQIDTQIRLLKVLVYLQDLYVYHSMRSWEQDRDVAVTDIFRRIDLPSIALAPLTIAVGLKLLNPTDTPSSMLSLRCLLPWDPTSPLQWACSSGPTSASFFQRLGHLAAAPLPLMLIGSMIHKHVGDLYRNVQFASAERSRFTGARDKILALLDWSDSLEKNSNNVEQTSNDRSLSGSTNSGLASQIFTVHTKLTDLPSSFLRSEYEQIFWTIAYIPFESLFLRSLTTSYLQFFPLRNGSLPRRSIYGLYTSFGGGPFGRLVSSPGSQTMTNAINYASKIGLMIALQAAMACIGWGALYLVTRGIGVLKFHWKRSQLHRDRKGH